MIFQKKLSKNYSNFDLHKKTLPIVGLNLSGSCETNQNIIFGSF